MIALDKNLLRLIMLVYLHIVTDICLIIRSTAICHPYCCYYPEHSHDYHINRGDKTAATSPKSLQLIADDASSRYRQYGRQNRDIQRIVKWHHFINRRQLIREMLRPQKVTKKYLNNLMRNQQ